MREGMTCYERDEELCDDERCLLTGCQLRNIRLAATKEIKLCLLLVTADSLLASGSWFVVRYFI